MAAVTRRQVFLGVLCYGGQVCWEWARCWHAVMQTGIISQVASIAGDSLVSRARNSTVAEFLATKGSPDDLFAFWDCDIEMEPWMFHRLASHNKPIVCAMYPIKQLKPQWVTNLIPGEKPDANGLMRVRESGTGIMMIQRRVFTEMAAKYPEIAFNVDDNEPGPKQRWDFFSVGVKVDAVNNKRRFLSEDYYFCHRWRDMGGEIFLDTRVQGRHIGRMTFPVPEQDLRVALREYEKDRAPAPAPTATIVEAKGNQAA